MKPFPQSVSLAPGGGVGLPVPGRLIVVAFDYPLGRCITRPADARAERFGYPLP
jgi:hypothetical protein